MDKIFEFWLSVLVVTVCLDGAMTAQTRVTEKGINNAELTKHVIVMNERIDDIEKLLLKQEFENDKQKNEIRNLKQENDRLKADINGLRNKIDNGTDLCSLRNGHGDTTPRARNNLRRLLMNPGTSNVAFTAYLDHELSNPGIDQTIIFNRVLFNDGAGYHSASGVFSCPVSGVYMFFFSLGSGLQHQIVAKLVTNTGPMVGVITDSEYHSTHEAQGSNMVILRLLAGTHVWIENYRNTFHHVEGSDVDRFSTFSGILLYQ